MLRAEHISKRFDSPAGPLPILDRLDLTLEAGQAASIMGPSGSGKTTLLSILGALDPPSEGSVTLDGRNPYTLGPDELAEFRNRSVGFVFQDHSLLPQCTVLENVLIPTLATGSPSAAERDRARYLLDQVGLGARLDHVPAQLSGGERQRAAIARALIRDPLLLLCDEPTGNLDRQSAASVASLIAGLHARRRGILIVVTHSPELAARFPLRFEIQDGRLQSR